MEDEKKALTKTQVIAALAGNFDMPKKEMAALWDGVLDLAASEVKRNGSFILPGFGKLVKQHRAARMGRNPATGEAVSIKAKTVVKFRLSKACKDTIGATFQARSQKNK
jgi:DNA-binding protein HU-beta